MDEVFGDLDRVEIDSAKEKALFSHLFTERNRLLEERKPLSERQLALLLFINVSNRYLPKTTQEHISAFFRRKSGGKYPFQGERRYLKENGFIEQNYMGYVPTGKGLAKILKFYDYEGSGKDVVLTEEGIELVNRFSDFDFRDGPVSQTRQVKLKFPES